MIAVPKTIDNDTLNTIALGVLSSVAIAREEVYRAAAVPGSNRCVIVEVMGRNMGSRRASPITLSDRTCAGEYEDLNGPKIIDILKNYFQDQPWNISFEKVLITDNRNLLKKRSNKNPMQLYTVFLNIKTNSSP